MSKNIKIAIGVVLIIIVGYALRGSFGGKLGGAVTPSDIRSTNYDLMTVNGLTVNTSNTATSTISLGCIQTTATSTATPVRFVASTTSLVNGVSTGVVLVQFGSCPI